MALVILMDCGAERKENKKDLQQKQEPQAGGGGFSPVIGPLFTLIWVLVAAATSITLSDQTLVLTRAALTVNGRGRLSRGRAVAMLHQDSGCWLGAAVVMQGGSHLGAHATRRRTHAAVLGTSWSRRV